MQQNNNHTNTTNDFNESKHHDAKLKLAIIGSRGYPYVYSGYETLVKALVERLPAKGVEITVYCHAHLFPQKPAMVNGVRLVYIPTLPFKSLAQPIHSFFAFWHMVFTKVDVALVLNVSNGPFGIIARLFGKPTMMNVDGLEWLRPKWKGFGGVYFKWAAKMATRFMDLLITDADAMQSIYLKEFGAKSVVITYGAETSAGADLPYLSDWNLVERDYYLIVGRMIPDNNADILIEGFIQSNSTKKLVIVGDVPYQDAYADKIRSYQDPRLVFTGYVRSPETLASLYKYCYAYLHGHEFGGTNPTLLKAMANGCAIAALDTVFSREVLQNEQFGFYFSKSPADCTRWFNWAESHFIDIEAKRAIIHQGITEKYTWETVSDLYLYHLKSLATKK
jgi:glycosyltransferase involved in cell wall biosynthesis